MATVIIGAKADAIEFLSVKKSDFNPFMACANFLLSLYKFEYPSFIPEIIELNALVTQLNIKREDNMPFNLDVNFSILLFELFADLVNLEKAVLAKSPIFFIPDFATSAPFDIAEKTDLPVFPSLL